MFFLLCMHLFTCVCLLRFKNNHIHMPVCAYRCACIHVCIYMYVLVCVCTDICASAYKYIYWANTLQVRRKDINACTNLLIYVYIHNYFC